MEQEAHAPLSVIIGDQTLRMRATPEERARFERAAETVNTLLKDFSQDGVATENRLLAMAAFELAVELLEAREAVEATGTADVELKARLQRLIERLQGETTA